MKNHVYKSSSAMTNTMKANARSTSTAPIVVEGETRAVYIQEQMKNRTGGTVSNIAESVQFERSKLPDGSMRFLVNRRDFSDTFGPNERVTIMTPTADFIIQPRVKGDGKNSTTIDSHMDNYFRLQEDGARWLDELEEQGSLQCFLMDWKQFGLSEIDIMNFRASASNGSDVSSTETVESALNEAIAQRILSFNHSNINVDNKTVDKLSTFRPLVEAVAG